LIAVQKIIVTF